jgi:multicomponent Na+:H+ antiporter subunit E
VIYANSITLTPGTITTGIIGDTFEIHALTGAAWDGTEEGETGRRVCQLEGEV